MPSYKLQYFNLRARAELIRLIFAEAGVKYEDERVSDWPGTVKSTTPFGQLPVLYIDGKPLCQSLTICRYLARIFKLEGENELQAAYGDMLVSSLEEVIFNMPFREKDPAIKAAKVEEQLQKIYPRLEKIESHFKTEGGDYLIGKKFTYTDLFLLHTFHTLSVVTKDNLGSKFPYLSAVVKRVADRPNIKKWLAERPNNPM